MGELAKRPSSARSQGEVRKPPSWEKGDYKIEPINTMVLLVPVLLTLYGCFTTSLQWNTFLVACISYYLSGIGITAGYHRMWSHRAYDATIPLQWALAIMGAAAYQGSIKYWCRFHRMHHRYIDTDRDPYNARRGFFYTHYGWMLIKQDFQCLGRVDIGDLKSSSIIEFQHKYYLPIAFVSGVLVPWVICGLGWGDWAGGLFYGAMARIVVVHNTTFFINSLAHSSLFGAIQTYTDRVTAHDSFFTAILTLGEGYHNFHHEFPNDYRNGVRFYHYDPTKWTIRVLAWLGLAYNLTRVPSNEIKRDQVQMQLKQLHSTLSTLQRGPEKETLPVWSWETIQQKCKEGAKLTVIQGRVIDCCKTLSIGAGLTHGDAQIRWYDAHPGGRGMLDAFVGKNATTAFEGEIYTHSDNANNILTRLTIATVKDWEDPNID